jgi:hypothetical protein
MKVGRSRRTSTTKQMHTFKHIFQNCRLLLALLFIVTLASCTPRRALTQQGVLDLAGVSVVRLVVYYTVPTSPILGDPAYKIEQQCTGLGTLVGSWSPASPTEKNNWVLTDGTLVNTNGGTCLPGQLAGIQILANNAYTNNSPGQALIGSLQCHRPGQETTCSDTEPETISSSAGAVLFSFHTDANHLQPFLPVDAQQSLGTPQGIELASKNALIVTWPSRPVLTGTDTAQAYLTPRLVDTTAGNNNSKTSTATSNSSSEPGMPIVDSNGKLVGMSLTGNRLLTGQAILNLMNQVPALQSKAQAKHTNILNATWNLGIQQYEASDYTDAQATLHQIETTNQQFLAPRTFELTAAAHMHNGPNGAPTPTTGASHTQGGTLVLLFLIGLIAGLLILITLLLVMFILRRFRKQILARFEAEQAEARLTAEREVQPQQNVIVEKPKPAHLFQRVAPGEPKTSTVIVQSSPEIPCPNCGHAVRTNAAYCPYCHYWVLPVAPGASPTVLTLPAPELPSSKKALPSSTAVPAQQTPINGAVLDDLTIPATLQRLWDRAGR